MGVAITTTPEARNVVMAYRPIIYRVQVDIAEASEPQAGFVRQIEVGVTWDGTTVATVRKDWATREEVTPTNWRYVYFLDLQRIAQDNLLPSTAIKSGVFGVMVSPPFQFWMYHGFRMLMWPPMSWCF